MAYAPHIQSLVITRRVQTNEVGRCTGLLPAFELVYSRAAQPLALVEIGASAGLHLLWDHYRYQYGDRHIGAPYLPVTLPCEVRGGRELPLSAALPPVAYRIGIDLNPVDTRDPEQVRWLRALIWPEQVERAALFQNAVSYVATQPVEIVPGNALDVLPGVIDNVPSDAALCLYHSYTFNQMPPSVRDPLLTMIANIAQQRDLYRIALEWYDPPAPKLELSTYHDGDMQVEFLAYCESHGRWIEWQ
jgi:hypothetical protein